MLHIGLTGGIAAGKSTAAAVLSDQGAHLIDADQLARDVVAAGTQGLAAVVETFGREILTSGGTLDRAALGQLVFANPEALAELNAIVHPLVARRTAEQIAALPDEAIVVHDVPLIVENDLGHRYHLVLVAGAGETERLRRLTSGRGMAEADALARIRAQADDDERRKIADVWLDTETPQEQTRERLEQLWRTRLVPYAQNISRGQIAERAGSVRIVTPPPPPRTWGVQADQILDRLRRHLGQRIRTAHHIGSTSVPGLPAKDVLDLQLGVDTLTDADQVADALREAGFPRRAGITTDNAKPDDPDPARWAKRFHASADPGRSVNVHLRVVGGPGWRFALAFRDWLRAEGDLRDEYTEVKRVQVATAGSSRVYAEGKEPWFNEVWPRLRTWTEQTNWTPPEH